MHGHIGLALPVLRGSERLVLKVSRPDEGDDDTAHVSLALSVWDGRGAVRVCDACPGDRALLLERLESGGASLEALPISEGLTIAAGLLRRLAVPAPTGIPLLRDVASVLVETLPTRWTALGKPFSLSILDSACEAARRLGPASARLLVNWDIHFDNILPGTREPWLAIDPKVVAGDPEYGVAQLLWTQLDTVLRDGGLDHYFSLIVKVAALDRARARAWTLVRCCDYWLWALGQGYTEVPKSCAVLADWLCCTDVTTAPQAREQ